METMQAEKVTKWVTPLYGKQKTPYLKGNNDIPVFQFKEFFSAFLLNECAVSSINRNIEVT